MVVVLHRHRLIILLCSVTKAGGALGVITALVAYYIGLSELLSAEDQAVFHLPLGAFSKN